MATRQGASRLILCLSGGGFRASLFHLGMMRRLHEIGVLEQVDTVSSVSGGSIVAGFVVDRLARGAVASLAADQPWVEAVEQPFREFTSHDHRTGAVLRHILWNWAVPGPRARAMVRDYQRHLSSLALAEIPDRPQLVLCATDVSFGVNWTFGKHEVGDYLAGYAATPPDLPLAFAVAASACFPPVFGPVRVPIAPEHFKRGTYRGADRAKIMAGLALTDGGVYDNLGLEPALKKHDVAIVSDAGSPFPFVVSKAPILRFMRYPSLVMKQVVSLRRRQLMGLIADSRFECEHIERPDCRIRRQLEDCPHHEDPGCRDHEARRGLQRGVYLGLSSDVAGYVPRGEAPWAGYPRELVKGVISNIRTDLDAFTPAEQEILINHGYSLADAAIRRHLPELAPQAGPGAMPYPQWSDAERVARALRSSNRRVSLARVLGRGGRSD